MTHWQIKFFVRYWKQIKQVNMGSLSESAGLKAGDVILRVNEVDVLRLRHQEALDAIAQAGNQFQLHIGR
jgi:C-terminal processing protease CtpA/Prc